MSQLNESFQRLNPQQREAVKRIYGPTLVIAGPGTGKTQMLTLRITYLLQQPGINPENILCLTFTENGAKEMRERLSRWIGPTAYKVQIQTFHGFCDWVMRHYRLYFSQFKDEMEIASDLDKAQAFLEVTQKKSWEYFQSPFDDFTHQYDLLQAISNLKRENFTPKSLLESLPEEKEHLLANPENYYKRPYKEFKAGDPKPQKMAEIDQKIAKMAELSDFWEAWDSTLKKHHQYDFDDMIQWVVQAITQYEDLRYDLQEKFQWLMVDEYQDTNDSQNAILWGLCADQTEPNLFAVGDDDQSIYRFQGASLKNMLDFQSRFPTTQLIQLTHNYRSVQPVLDAAYNIVQHNQERLIANKKLESQRPDAHNKSINNVIELEKHQSLTAEYQALAKQIQKLLAAGIPHTEIAILVRNNSEILPITQELALYNIPSSNRRQDNIFENPSVRFLIQCLEVHANSTADETLFPLLHHPLWQIPHADLLQLSLKRKSQKQSFYELWLEDHPPKNKEESPSPYGRRIKDEGIPESIHKTLNQINQQRSLHYQARPRLLSEAYLIHLGLASYLQKNQLTADWMAVKKWLQWLREQRFETIEEVLEIIALHEKLSIPVLSDPLPHQANAVQIMTAHKSKGLEFDHVFIPALWDKKWGNQKSIQRVPLPHITQNQHDPLEDERRLLFVALTRARTNLYLSYSEQDFGGRAKNISPLALELPDSLQPEDSEMDVDILASIPQFISNHRELSQSEAELIGPKAQNFVWSTTSLQDYLDSPRKFLYKHLYRYPSPPKTEPQLALGTALHQALEMYLREASQSVQKPTNLKDSVSQTGLDTGSTPHPQSFSPREKEALTLFDTLPSTFERMGGSEEALLNHFDYALRGQSLDKNDFLKLTEHGHKILRQYYQEKLQHLKTDHPFGYELEFDFGRHKPQIHGIQITGKMDKIVFLNAEKKAVRIVDYKSGRPKPIKPGERLWRQLVFYDLLAQSCPTLNWHTRELELKFLTPDPKNQLGARQLTVTPEDTQAVINELKTADEAVKNLHFPQIHNPENDSETEYWNNFGE